MQDVEWYSMVLFTAGTGDTLSPTEVWDGLNHVLPGTGPPPALE